jgi:hypothetical protein
MKQGQTIQQQQPIRRLTAIAQIMSISRTRKGLLAAIGLATILLTAGYLLGRLWLQVPVVFLVGVLWWVCVLRDIRWVASLLFLVMMGEAAVGYMANLSHILMLAAGCANVVAWDLHQLEGRLLDLDEPATKEMEKQHLLRSLMVLGSSFLVIVAASMLQIRIKFIVLIFVTIIVILVLNQIMLLVRKIGKPAEPNLKLYKSTPEQKIFSYPERWRYINLEDQPRSSSGPRDKK